jgi:hypothetical protein
MKRIVFGLMLSTFTGTAAADHYVRPHVPRDSSYTERIWKSEANRLRFESYSSEDNLNLYRTQEPGYETNDFSNPPVYPNLLRKGWGR